MHHIVPKFMGGSNYKENLVRLTIRQHYLCHLLLVKALENTNIKRHYFAAVCAVQAFTMHWAMPSRFVLANRKKLSEQMKGKTPHNKGKQHSPRTKSKMSSNHWLRNGGTHPLLKKGHSEKSKQKMRTSKTQNWWTAISPEGRIYERISLPQFIEEHNLNIDIIRKHRNTKVPLPGVRYIKHSGSSRMNTVGWLFQQI